MLVVGSYVYLGRHEPSMQWLGWASALAHGENRQSGCGNVDETRHGRLGGRVPLEVAGPKKCSVTSTRLDSSFAT